MRPCPISTTRRNIWSGPRSPSWPRPRDLYSSEYGRSNPYDNSQRYRSPYGDNGQMESQLLGATEDVQGAMQGMEDLLLPLLKDLKQGFDNSLRQNAIRR